MTCPICSKSTVQAYRPFCSRRCADLDLARWLNGTYAVSSDAVEDDETPGAPRTDDVTRPH